MKIPGKLKDGDATQLQKLVDGKNVLMLGCYCGRGLLTVVKCAWATWVLDDFRGYPGSMEGVIAELKINFDRHAPEDCQVVLLSGTPAGWIAPDDQPHAVPGMIDFVYRDADRPEFLRGADDDLAMVFLQRYGGVYAWHNHNHELKWLVVEPVPVEVN